MALYFVLITVMLLALLPLLMTLNNLRLFQPLPHISERDAITTEKPEQPMVSVLIPARDEEKSIAACLESILQCTSVPIEVIVWDDNSTDNTGAICEAISQQDARVRVASGSELPEGWNGKQHGCWQLANLASAKWLLFLDADVRLTSDAINRMVAYVENSDVDLLSGFPKQQTGTLFERMLIPLMHFILLGYLPLARMRASNGPEFAAGCGQLFLARRDSYFRADGHRAIASSRHDGVKLPRSFRKHGLKTDLFDATDMAACRMYTNAKQVIRGLLKNAVEGIASPKTIVPFTILLGGAAVLPMLLLIYCLIQRQSILPIVLACTATAISYAPRVLNALRFQQSWLGWSCIRSLSPFSWHSNG